MQNGLLLCSWHYLYFSAQKGIYNMLYAVDSSAMAKIQSHIFQVRPQFDLTARRVESRLDRRSLTSSPPQIRTWTSRFIRFLPAFLFRPHSLKLSQKEPGSSPALAGLTNAWCELTHPFRSGPITEPSTLILDDPSPSCASILSPFVDLTYRVFS